jgi:hypothetical protein
MRLRSPRARSPRTVLRLAVEPQWGRGNADRRRQPRREAVIAVPRLERFHEAAPAEIGVVADRHLLLWDAAACLTWFVT